ncbi:LexA family transcriptional regulator [Paraburkholderia xenovorans]|uniref:LexA family transcriptional regulator n=1 Tax=Paraburkholderia xenovorans TaxID=36873 RepID=UPI0038BD0C35
MADANRLRSLFENWQAERKSKGEPSSQTDAAHLLGFGQSALSQYLRGAIPLNIDVLAKFATLLGSSRDAISPELAAKIRALGDPEHNNEASRHTLSNDSAASIEQRDHLIKRLLPDGKGNVIAWEAESDLPEDPERVWIDRYDYQFSAGSGLIQWEVREKHALPFNRSFFRALGSNPKDCRLLVVRGDSMEPFLFNRDVFMIDATKTRVRDGGIYAVYFEDEPLVKRIFKRPGGALILNSYNSTKFPDREISVDELEYVRVVGELIYRSGSGPAGGN